MLVFLIRRLLQLIPVLIGVTFLVFSMLHLIPGDPARIMAGEAAQTEQIERLREELGLNDPILVQYFRFVTNAVQGDLGNSIRTGRPVSTEIFETRFQTTIQLAVAATAAAILMGLIIGITSAMWKYTLVDTGLMLFSLVFLSIPNFLAGILLMNFLGVQLRLLPLTGWGTPQQMVMPVVMIGLTGSVTMARMTRASLIDVLNQDYIRTALAKGISERVAVFKHALRNALVPVVTIAGLVFGGMLGGALITETIFAINGMGRLAIDALRVRDFPVVQGTILVIATMFVLVNCLVDITYRVINKRIDTN